MGERNTIIKDLAEHVLESFRPAMKETGDLLDNDLERAKCAIFVLANVASWAGVYFAKHHKAQPPGTPEGEQARIAMTCAVLDLAKEIVNGEALKRYAAPQQDGPAQPDAMEGM